MQIRLLFLLSTVFFFQKSQSQSDELYKTIVKLDSIFFHAYNTCDMRTQGKFLSDSIEFFHDRGGLETSKQRLLESIERNICGKVTRQLIPGSVEVSPIPGYGAVQIGMHKFFNKQEPDAPQKPSRFVTLWRFKDDEWTITKVISLH